MTAVASLVGVVGVIVVDDASSDETAKLATEAGAVIERLARHRGKGAALNHALSVLENIAPFGPWDSLDAVVLLDADLGASADQVSLLLTAIEKGADMAIATFPPVLKKLGFGKVKGLAHDVILELGGFDAHAPLCGQRALTMTCLKEVRPFADGFGVEVAMSVQALWAGMRLVEVQTTMSHRESGQSLRGFLHRGRQYLDVAHTKRVLLRTRNKLMSHNA